MGINEMPWRKIFRDVSLALAILALVGTIVGVLIAGKPAAGGFLTGLTLVYLSFAVGIMVVIPAEKKSMKAAAAALAAMYPFKILVFTGLLVFAPIPHDFRNGWLMTGALVALAAQLVIETKIISKQRILYFDSVG
ncbi:MAG: hypothetical protein Q4A03_08060 [Rothia sp. (in: high G+C Gram-positive bacteria)]|uniref:hypothetical protein n=1 Tax=Rothia sp. (in: high G+C Gram-positive bacteria) TaxID=1885016 RepID=UPI00270C252A|nr:hypothetical protein [Rothia sp. (in: high G+C Gram-positive bacteria)]